MYTYSFRLRYTYEISKWSWSVKFLTPTFFEKSIKSLHIIIMQRHTFVYKTRLLLKAQKSIIEIFRRLFSFMHRLFKRERSIKRSMKIKDQFWLPITYVKRIECICSLCSIMLLGVIICIIISIEIYKIRNQCIRLISIIILLKL